MWSYIAYAFLIYILVSQIGALMFFILQSANQMKLFVKNDTDQWTYMMAVLSENNFTESDIVKVVKKLHFAHEHKFIDDEIKETAVIWDIYNAFFFALSLTTTIGYGNVVPKTVHGQIVSMVFTLLGIPMNILLTKGISEIYSKKFQLSMQGAELRGSHSCMAVFLSAVYFLLPLFVVFLVIPSIVFMYTEKWTFLEGVYYSLITLATIGFGDYVSGKQLTKDGFYVLYKIAMLIWILLGLSFIAMVMTHLAHAFRMKAMRKIQCRNCKLRLVKAQYDDEETDFHITLYENEKVDEAEDGIESDTAEEYTMSGDKKKQLHDLEVTIQNLKASREDELRDLESKKARLEAQRNIYHSLL